jgi:hypothetical protein
VTSGPRTPSTLDHAKPRVLHDLVSDGTVGDVESGDAAEARVIVVNEARKRAFVTSAERFDHGPIVGCVDLLHRSPPDYLTRPHSGHDVHASAALNRFRCLDFRRKARGRVTCAVVVGPMSRTRAGTWTCERRARCSTHSEPKERKRT